MTAETTAQTIIPFIFLAIIALWFLAMAVRIIREYQRAVMFTLGRFTGVRGRG